MTTDTSERGLEDLICTTMTGRTAVVAAGGVHDPVEPFGGTGWLLGDARDYDREYCVDVTQLHAFVEATQPEIATALELEKDTPVRRRFLARVESECARRGVIDLLRKGVKHEKYHIDLFYGSPSPGNDKAAQLYIANRFSLTRQLRYSRDETRRALDLALFINGLPIATFELKNSLTKQTWRTPLSSTAGTAILGSGCSASSLHRPFSGG
jgi:Type I site-specific restriction-modification system, R (restriction) subunit and related helicases